MKTEFKAKFLQHVAKRNKEEGFTLIELLVVIIIIGILSAIALPSFLSQANKAKQSEAKQYVSSLNKGQMALYTEATKFSTSIDELGVGIKTQTTNYQYFCSQQADAALCIGKAINSDALHSYYGSVFLVGTGGAKTSRAIICETLTTTQTTFIGLAASDCGASMKEVGSK
jgi:prepilin-type N-terminal cleavage/methylation domain-containing protein